MNTLGLKPSNDKINNDGFYDMEIDQILNDIESNSYHEDWLETGEDFFGKRAKERRKKRRQKRKEQGKPVGFGNRIKAFGKWLSDRGLNPVYAPILPFKGLLRKILIDKGYSDVPKKIRDLVPFFHDKIIRKKGDPENLALPIGAIVSAIISFLKGVQDKVEKDPINATPFEKETAKQIIQVEKQIVAHGTDAVEETIGEKVLNFVKSPLGIAVVAMAVGLITYGIISVVKK